MKLKLFYYISIISLAFASNIKADELVIQNFEMEPGQQTTVSLELNNAENQYIMLDFYIQLPSGITIAKDEDNELIYELNSSRTMRSHVLEINEQSGGNYHVLVYSSKNEALKGTSGAVFTMTLQADANVSSGTYTGRLTNQITSDINKNEIDFPDKTFNVTVAGGSTNTTSDNLSIDDFEISKGGQAEVAIELNNAENQYIMLDFYIQLPSGITIAKDEDNELIYELNSSRTMRSHVLEINEQSGGNYHVLVYSSKNEALKGTSGAVFTMTLQADANVSSGTYTGRLTNQITSDINKNEIDFPDKTFNVTVAGGSTNTTSDNLSIDDFEISKGEQAEVAIELNNAENQYIMLDFYIQLPSGITIAKDEDNELMYELNSSRTMRSHILEINEQTGGNYHVLVYSSKNEALKGTSGAVFTMTLQADANVSSGTYTGRLTNQITSDINKNEIDFPDKTFNVTVVGKMPQTLSLSSLPTMTYGAAAYTLPAKTTQNLTLTWTSSNTNVATISGNTLTVKGAGTSTITATQSGNGTYNPFSKTYTLTVNKAPLTITADDKTKTAGQANPTLTITYSGFVNEESSSVLTTLPTVTTTATTSSAAGNYPITASGAAAANYSITYVAGTLTVVKADQNITLTEIPTMTYGDAAYTLPAKTAQNLTLTWTSSNTNVATISGNTLTVKGAGTSTITATQSGNGTYNPFSKTYTLTVNKAPLTITADDKTKTAGQANPALTITYSGFVNGESSSVLTTLPTVTTTATTSSAAGNYPITASGAAAANYSITYVAGTLTVVKADQSVTLTAIPTMTYGDAAYTLPDKTDQNQTLTWASNNTNVATTSGNTLTVKGAGTSTITATQSGNGTYNPFSKTYTLTVNKAVLTVTADDCSRMEGAENPAFTISYSGFKYNDNASSLTTQPTATTEANVSSPAGTYPIIVSGGESDNYEFNRVNGTLTVTAKSSQTIQLTEIAAKTYGDGAETLPASTEQGLSLTWTSDNASVATVSGNTLTVKGAGETTVTASNDGDATHNPFSKTFTLTVSKAVLTVTADDCSRMEGAENPAFTISYSGFKYNDNASSLTTQPTATTEANVSSPAGTYPITVSGGESDNYEFNRVNGTLTVIDDNQDLYIQFADANVKALCVANWDTNGDGRLSYDEAAAVTDLGTVFQRASITTFDELQYFTSLSTISDNAFYYSTLTNVVIPNSVTSIGNKAFERCKISSVRIPEGVTSIGNGAFQYSGLKSVEIPNSVTSLGNSAFYGCSGLTSLAIGKGVSSIGLYVFDSCDNLFNVTLNNNNIVSKNYTDSSNLKNIFGEQVRRYVIGDAVTSIGKYAFELCRNVESVIIGNHVTSIGAYAFSACSSITSLEIPNSVVTIDGSAFSSCSSLTSLSFGNGLTTIGGNAFFGCSGLTSIEIPQSVTSIVKNPFESCSGLTTMTVDANNTVYDSRNNCNAIIEKSTNTLISGCKNTIIPNTVSAIGYSAFYGCKGLTSIDIPNSVTTIGGSAFFICTGLTSVSIGNGVTSLGSSAFLQCTSLANVTMGNRVTSIGSNAFYLCNSLNSMTIPASVTSIGDYAFRCENLTLLEVKNSVPIQITQYTFPYRTNTTLVVPDGALDKYKRSIYWSNFKYIINKEYDMSNMLVLSDLLVEHGAWIDFPVSMNNQEQITAAEFDLEIPENFTLLECSLSDRKNDHDVSFSLLDGGTYHITIFSLSSSAFKENDGVLLYLQLLADAHGQTTVYIKNIELSTQDGSRLNPPDISAKVTICDIPVGDVNGDGEVTISDAVAIVNYRLGRKQARFVRAAADVNGDSEITITDAVRIVNMILSAEAGAKSRAQSFELSHDPQ